MSSYILAESVLLNMQFTEIAIELPSSVCQLKLQKSHCD